MPESLRLALSIVGIIVVIAGAYYATYFVGMKASGQSRSKNRGWNRNIRMLERFAISKDKSFCIVEIAGKVYIVGVTNQSMSLLDTLDAEAFEEYRAESGSREAWNPVPGGPYSGKLVNRLASFMAQRMGNRRDMSGNTGTKSTGFADSMKTARERNISGRPSREKAERTEDSEGK